MEVDHNARYACVRCGAESMDLSSTEFRCNGCSYSYPVFAEVPILTLRPHALLRAATRALRTTSSHLDELCGEVTPVKGSGFISGSTQERVQRALAGMRANMTLVESLLKPAEAADGSSVHLDLLDTLSNCGAGWTPDSMLPYFYQDWSGSEHFEVVKATVITTLRQHVRDTDACAVLGAGACGLLYALAPEFTRAYGIDLSLPTLLIAQQVLRGYPITVHLKNVDWCAAQLKNLDVQRSNVRLAVADASRLPFPDSSLSAIVTQYLMDIVGNPLHIAGEICRVLKPQGVWVNFSLPIHAPNLPTELRRLTLEELPDFLKPVNFELIEARHVPFSFLNLRQLSKTTTVYDENVPFFAARNLTEYTKSLGEIRNESLALNSDRQWWQAVPKLAVGRRLEIASIVAHHPGRRYQRVEASFGFSFAAEQYVLEENIAQQLQALCGMIDGSRTFKEIYDAQVAQGLDFGASGFRELFHYLSDRVGLVDSA